MSHNEQLTYVHVFCCDPWESYITELVRENEAERRIYELERDIQWEIENGYHDERTNIHYVPVELLPELQSMP